MNPRSTDYNVDALTTAPSRRYEYVVVVVITPPLPRDGGTARTAIQVQAVNLIEIRLGEMAAHFEPIMNDW